MDSFVGVSSRCLPVSVNHNPLTYCTDLWDFVSRIILVILGSTGNYQLLMEKDSLGSAWQHANGMLQKVFHMNLYQNYPGFLPEPGFFASLECFSERFFSEAFSQSTCIWPAGSCSWAAVDPHATPGVAAASKLWRSRIVQAKLWRRMFTNLIEGLGKYQVFLWKQLSKWSALSFRRSMEWKWSMQMHRNKTNSKHGSGRLLALSAAWEHGKRGKCRWLALAALANATVYRHQALCIVWFPCAPHQTRPHSSPAGDIVGHRFWVFSSTSFFCSGAKPTVWWGFFRRNGLGV